MAESYNSYREGNDDPQDEKFRKLFIGGLNYETTVETMKQHFEQWGEIVDCVVLKGTVTKKSRGFGFITYKTAEMLDEAQKNRPHKLDGRELDTKRATPRDESNESQSSVKKIFIGGLKDGTAEDDIREVFSHFGKIEELVMITDKDTGKQKGFCFLTFDDFDAVDKCVLRQRISLNGKSVQVKKAFPKDQGGSMAGGRGGSMAGGRGGSVAGGRRGYDGSRGGMGSRGSFGGGGYNNGSGYQRNMGYPKNKGNGGQQGFGSGGNWGGQQGFGSGGNWGGQPGYGGRGNQCGTGSGGNLGGYGSGGQQGYGGRGNQGGYGRRGQQGYRGRGNLGGYYSSGPQGYGGSGIQGGYSNGGPQGYGGSGYNSYYGSGNLSGPTRGPGFAQRRAGPYGTGYGSGGKGNYIR